VFLALFKLGIVVYFGHPEAALLTNDWFIFVFSIDVFILSIVDVVFGSEISAFSFIIRIWAKRG